jgi:hypothetical protein
MESFTALPSRDRHTIGTYEDVVDLQSAAEAGGLLVKVNEHRAEAEAQTGNPQQISIDFGRTDTGGMAFLDTVLVDEDEYALAGLDLNYGFTHAEGVEVSGSEQFIRSGEDDIVQSTSMVRFSTQAGKNLLALRATGSAALSENTQPQIMQKISLQFPGENAIELNPRDRAKYPAIELKLPNEVFDILPHMHKVKLQNSGKELLYACFPFDTHVFIMVWIDGVRLSVDFPLPTAEDVDETADKTVEKLSGGDLPVRFAPRAVGYTRNGLN